MENQKVEPTNQICFTKVREALQAKSLNHRITTLNTKLKVFDYMLESRLIKQQRSEKNREKTLTETDNIRSTPLSGFCLQTSRIDVAILAEISLSEMKLEKFSGSRTTYVRRQSQQQFCNNFPGKLKSQKLATIILTISTFQQSYMKTLTSNIVTVVSPSIIVSKHHWKSCSNLIWYTNNNN